MKSWPHIHKCCVVCMWSKDKNFVLLNVYKYRFLMFIFFYLMSRNDPLVYTYNWLIFWRNFWVNSCFIGHHIFSDSVIRSLFCIWNETFFWCICCPTTMMMIRGDKFKFNDCTYVHMINIIIIIIVSCSPPGHSVYLS